MSNSVTRPLIALLAAAGLMGGAALVHAQDYGEHAAPPPATTQEQVDETTVNNFIAAYQEVQAIHQDYSQQLQAAEDPESATELQQEAQEKMQEAVTSNGLTIAEYQQVANLAGQDPELRARIEEALTQ